MRSISLARSAVALAALAVLAACGGGDPAATETVAAATEVTEAAAGPSEDAAHFGRHRPEEARPHDARVFTVATSGPGAPPFAALAGATVETDRWWGTLGNAGRNILRSTGQRATDFSAFKNFDFRERARLQFRAEFFNLFSSYFYSPRFPNVVPTATNFGSLLPPLGDERDPAHHPLDVAPASCVFSRRRPHAACAPL